MRKKAFTLAEVLLTLAIIGVVAALTIPAVITKVTQDQYVVGLKKAYNTLKVVEREAVRDHGEMINWDWSNNLTAQFESYFLPYFDVLKNCGADTDDGCFATYTESKFLNGTTLGVADDYNSSSYYRIITSDGISLAYRRQDFTTNKGRVGAFFVDVNGKKGPNVVGRDIFSFNVFPSAGIKPYAATSSNDGTQTFPSSNIDIGVNGCNLESGRGFNCTVKVLSEGSMSY